MLKTEMKPDGMHIVSEDDEPIAVLVPQKDKRWLILFAENFNSSGLDCHLFDSQVAAEYLVLAAFIERNERIKRIRKQLDLPYED